MLISRADSVAANTRSANVLAGEQFEFIPPGRAIVRVRATGSAAGLRADLQIGAVTVIANGVIPPTNRFPVIPDDNLAEFWAVGGERLFLTYLNTTAGALTANTVIEILPA